MAFRLEFSKYTIVGLFNFVLTFMIFTILLKLFSISYNLSLIAAWIVGTIFSYILNFIWVFQPETNITFNHRFIKFISIGLVSITINILILNYLVKITNVDPFYLQFIIMPFIVVFNFITTKYWSLKRSF